MQQETTKFPFRRLVPEELLGGNTHYRIPSGQIIFYFEKWESFVITTIDNQDHFTEQTTELLPESAPYELINGKLIFMPAPKFIHQKVLINLSAELRFFLKKNKIGELGIAPLDVVLDKKNAVQPDILFIGIKGAQIIDGKVYGAPDFVVEILSSNEAYDRGEKMQNYARHGVVEYWLVQPVDEFVEVYHNKEGEFTLSQKAVRGDFIQSKAIEGFELELSSIFED